MRRILQPLITILAIYVSACAGSADDKLSLAESEYESGRYETAQSLADELISGENADTVSVGRLCRLYLLCAKLAEHQDEGSNLAAATRCMQTAMQRDSDSVAAFIETLTIEDRTRTALVTSLMRAAEFPADSIAVISEPYEDE